MSYDTAPRKGIIGTWFGPITRDNASAEIHHISGVLMTLALIQLVFSVGGYLLPQLPLGWSDLPWRHLVYGPAIFALGYIYGATKVRTISLVAAAVLVAAILYEGYDYVTRHMDMIQADLNYNSLAIAGVWRIAILLLAVRGVYAALRAPG